MNVFKTMMVAGAVLMFFTGASQAQTLTASDTSEIVNVSRNNELKFKRDYKGKTFSDTMTYKGAGEAIFGGSWFIRFNGVTCSVEGGSPVLSAITDWDKGRKVSVTGVLDDTMLGTIHLNNCRFS